MPETTRIVCPHCGQAYNLRPEQWAQFQGRTTTCKKCQQKFKVAVSEEAAGEAIAPTAEQGAAPAPLASVPAAEPAASVAEPMAAPPPVAPDAPPQTDAGEAEAAPVRAKRGNGMAVASLILGILFFIPLSSLVAVILGIVGLKRAKLPGVGGKGLALTGLILGVLGVVSWAGAGAVGVPWLLHMRQVKQRLDCASNMHNIAEDLVHYANVHGSYPPDLDTLAKDQNLPAQKFICPASGDAVSTPDHESYVYVGAKLSFSSPPNAVMMYEPLSHHGDGSNLLFADGHADFIKMTPQQAELVFSQLRAGKNPPPAMPAPSR